MTEEERRIITEFVQRIAGANQPAAAASSPWGGRMPSVGAQPQQPPLPPVDRDADQMIDALFRQYPEARYRITQTAFVQEHALVEANNRIQQLEWELESARREAEAGRNRGFLGLGGSRPAPMPPPPQPQYPPNYNPQALQQAGRGGSGFLGTALTTAAGVAGGMVLGNMLMNAFSGHSGAASAAQSVLNDPAAAAGSFAQEAVPASSPWTNPGGNTGGQDAAGAYEQTGYDQGNYQQDATGGYEDSSAGGFDDAAGGYEDDEY
jgi:hypothetical protein